MQYILIFGQYNFFEQYRFFLFLQYRGSRFLSDGSARGWGYKRRLSHPSVGQSGACSDFSSLQIFIYFGRSDFSFSHIFIFQSFATRDFFANHKIDCLMKDNLWWILQKTVIYSSPWTKLTSLQIVIEQIHYSLTHVHRSLFNVHGWDFSWVLQLCLS